MHNMLTLVSGRAAPDPFVTLHDGDLVAGVTVVDSQGREALRIRSTDVEQLGAWARALSDAADKLAAAQVNAAAARRRGVALAVADAANPPAGGPGLLRRATALRLTPLTPLTGGAR